jgi:hypothetical protein
MFLEYMTLMATSHESLPPIPRRGFGISIELARFF